MVNLSKSNIYIAAIAVFAFISFFVLDSFSISTGDDLGYMFTDSKLHNGDGHPISGILECVSTQASHYSTTNGRFIVHLLTSFFVSIPDITVFRLFNSLMFTILWSGVYILSLTTCGSDRYKCGMATLALVALWLSIPRPGVTMLSLVAYAINYLWTGSIIIIYLILLRDADHKQNKNPYRTIIILVASVIAGSLQESYSIPVCASLIISLILKKGHKTQRLSAIMISGFIIGTAICCLAPGNFNHIEQGGGFSTVNLLRKINALLPEIKYSAISLTLLASTAFCIYSPGRFKRFLNDNIFFYIAILVSIMLALLTFTSVRQLFAPSVFCCIIILRMVNAIIPQRIISSKILISAGIVILIILFTGAFIIRQNTFRLYSGFINHLNDSDSELIWTDVSDANYNHPEKYMSVFYCFDCDPFAGKDLRLLFDGYTKRGLSRLMIHSGERSKEIRSIFPANRKRIIDIATHSQKTDGYILPATLDSAYSCYSAHINTPHIPYSSGESMNRIPYERFRSGDSLYYVIPRSDRIRIK